MKWLSKKRKDEQQGYWQTIADALAALLLILLLLVMILILYIIRTQDEEAQLSTDGFAAEQSEDRTYGAGSDPLPGWGNRWDNRESGHGGGGTYETTAESTDSTDPVQPSTEPEETHDWGSEGPEKTAVYTAMLDAETGRRIQEENVTFRLLDGRQEVLTLYSYYPDREPHTTFSTGNKGSFYLPEKIPYGNYYLQQLTEPEGYDRSNDILLTADEARDWQDPLMVEVPMYPSRNQICIRTVDVSSGEPVEGAQYDILADGDIITADGTIRYTDGETADCVTSGADGTALSGELYLGAYLLKESQIPRFYASMEDLAACSAEKKSDSPPTEYTVPREKTEYTLQVMDELYKDRPAVGACFRIDREDKEIGQESVDSAGRLRLTDLEKTAVYRLYPVQGSGGYRFAEDSVEFFVDERGRIENLAQYHTDLTAWMLRLSVSVTDALLSGATVTRKIELYNDAGELMDHWDSNGASHIVAGLEPGIYDLRINGGNGHTVRVADTAQMQSVHFSVWTEASLLILGAAVLILAAAGGLCVYWRRARKKGV